MECLYSVESSKKGALTRILDETPYEKDSFPSVGYVVKDSNAVGLAAGKYLVYFSHEEAAVIAKLKERLSRVEGGVVEITGADKDKAVAVIKEEQDAAAGGFGSIFG